MDLNYKLKNKKKIIMATNNEFKNMFSIKFLEFQLNGLQQYSKYLNQQIKLSKNHENWEAYKKYIEKEIIRNDKKIEEVSEKLNALK